MTIKFIDIVKHYKGLPHQDKALLDFDKAVPAELVSDTSDLAKTWRSTPTKLRWQVTPTMLQCITGHAANKFPAAFCDDLQALFDATGFNTDLTARRMLVAQMCHESAGFKFMKEIDRGHYLEGRRDLGNIFPGDGPKFRGCGPIQLTGRHNHQRFANWMASQGKADPKIMSIGTNYTAEVYPFLCARTWIVENGYLNVCKRGDVNYATRILNGGFNGLADRVRYWERAKTCIT